MLARVIVIVLLGVINVAIFSKMIWGPTGILEYRELKRQHVELKNDIAKLDSENMAISRDIRLLQTDRQFVEKMVRQKLHYMRDNEIAYIFVDLKTNHKGEPANDEKN